MIIMIMESILKIDTPIGQHFLFSTVGLFRLLDTGHWQSSLSSVACARRISLCSDIGLSVVSASERNEASLER